MALQDYKDLVATLATIITIGQFLSGTDICRKIVKQGSTGDISGFPFVGGVFSTSMWLTYGAMLHDTSMMVTNATGLLLQIVYLFIYIRYCISPGAWHTIRRQVIVLISLTALLLYHVYASGIAKEVAETHMGFVVSVASIVFAAAPLASLGQVIRTKSTALLPFPLIIAIFFGTGLWWLYGIIIHNAFVQVPNALGCMLSFIQLTLFVIYPSKYKEDKEPLMQHM